MLNEVQKRYFYLTFLIVVFDGEASAWTHCQWFGYKVKGKNACAHFNIGPNPFGLGIDSINFILYLSFMMTHTMFTIFCRKRMSQSMKN